MSQENVPCGGRAERRAFCNRGECTTTSASEFDDVRDPVIGAGQPAVALDFRMSVEMAVDWRDRQVSAAEAVSVVSPGDKVFVGTACAGAARLPVEAGIGPNPQLPPPEHALIPSIKVAKATGWRAFVVDPRARFAQPARLADSVDVRRPG